MSAQMMLLLPRSWKRVQACTYARDHGAPMSFRFASSTSNALYGKCTTSSGRYIYPHWLYREVTKGIEGRALK